MDASSPPTPWRTSTITSFESAGSRLDERELELLLHLAEALLVLGDELAQLAVAAGGVEVGARLAPRLRQLVRRLELLQAPAASAASRWSL